MKYAFFFLTFFWKKDSTIEANLWETKFARLSTLWTKTLCLNIICSLKGIDFSQKKKNWEENSSWKQFEEKLQIDVVKKKNMRNSWLHKDKPQPFLYFQFWKFVSSLLT